MREVRELLNHDGNEITLIDILNSEADDVADTVQLKRYDTLLVINGSNKKVEAK